MTERGPAVDYEAMHPSLINACVIVAITAPVASQATWTQLYPSSSPGPRSGAMMACHEASNTMLMLFGSGQSDAWQFAGNAWLQLTGPLPPQRGSAKLVYDSARERLVLFGGRSQGNAFDDTWVWDGTSWSGPLLAVHPAARWGHAMAFDRDREVVVLYGGFVSTSSYREDLWEWDGVAWQLIATTNAPGGRFDSKMAFDPNSRNVLLHGGSVVVQGSEIPVNDTWTWDGAAWQQHQPVTPPTIRFGGDMVCDLDRRRVLLFGGSTGNHFAWEWDGSEWSIVLQASPSERSGHAMAYDSANRRTVLHGGNWLGSSSWTLSDTWVFESAHPATVTPYGSGCAGVAGAPDLAADAYALPWLGDTARNRVTNLDPAGSAVFFATGLDPSAPVSLAPFGMPGCDQLVTPAAVELAAASNGEATWSLMIPTSTSFAGVQLFQQVAALDPAANAAGLTVSNGVEMTIGIR